MKDKKIRKMKTGINIIKKLLINETIAFRKLIKIKEKFITHPLYLKNFMINPTNHFNKQAGIFKYINGY